MDNDKKNPTDNQKQGKWRCLHCVYFEFNVDEGHYYPGCENANHRCSYTGMFYPGSYPACKYFKL